MMVESREVMEFLKQQSDAAKARLDQAESGSPAALEAYYRADALLDLRSAFCSWLSPRLDAQIAVLKEILEDGQ